MSELPSPPKRPCGSCPYRCDVPSGIWHPDEYAKLLPYDGETWEQPPGLFMCHQRDGCICGGWLQTHDTSHLLALRLNRVHESAFGYQSDIPTFASGADAAAHGLAEVLHPTADARRLIDGLQKKREAR